MNALAKWLGTLLTPIIIAAVKEAFAQLKDTGEVGKPNKELNDVWNQNLPRGKPDPFTDNE